MPAKYGRQGRRLERVKHLASSYPNLKEALRERFFARHPLAVQLAPARVLGLPKLVTTQTYVAQRLIRTRTQQAYRGARVPLSRLSHTSTRAIRR